MGRVLLAGTVLSQWTRVVTVLSVELLLPVRLALAGAEELGWLLECIGTNEEHVVWILWQAQMMQHWAQVAIRDSSGYPTLAAGLIDFAATVQQRVHTGLAE